MMQRVAAILVLTGALLLLLIAALQTEAAPEEPLGRHCGDVGPLPFNDPGFCGCTWGKVLFHGKPVPGAAITLTYGGSFVTDTTHLTPLDPEPTFDVTGHNLGAQRGDVMTLTVRFAGKTITRAFRAWPEGDGEQHVALAFEERGVWSPWVTGGYTRTLVLSGDTVWAGGSAGVVSVSLSSGVSVSHALPWPDPSVRALAVGDDGHVWAAGEGGVAEFDGAAWQTQTVPLNGTIRAVAIDSTSGAVWLGSSEGGVAVYDGAWLQAGRFGAAVTALTVDETGLAWAATWGNGVYRQDSTGDWHRYRAADGLASDNVLAAAAGEDPMGRAVWFGTGPYLSGHGPRGGIARYDLEAESWRIYTTAHGLPADASFSQAPALFYAIAMDEAGRPWAGTTGGVRFLAEESWWAAYTATHGLRMGPIRALAPGNGTALAASRKGLDRLDVDATPGGPPVAQIDAVSPLTVTMGTTLTLRGRGADPDESGERIVAWDWSSSRDGPLCTLPACALPRDLFTLGEHTVTLRVQDDEGLWSLPVAETVTMRKAWRVCLPLVIRSD
jgi:hypothetical protein